MEKIRNAGKKHRKIMLAVVVCLCLSLVIGFATMGSLGNTTASLEDQIAYYEDYIADLEQKDDTATKGQLAALYSELAGLYSQSGDSEKYTEFSTKSNETYVTYYEAMVEEQRNAEGDNRALLASYLESLGTYYANVGNTEKSEAAKAESYELQAVLNNEYVATAKTDAESNADDAEKQYTVGYYLSQLGQVYTNQSKTDESNAAYTEAAGYYAKAAEIVDASLGDTPEHESLHSAAEYKLEEANAYSTAGDTEKATAAYLAAAGYYEQAVLGAEDMNEKAVDLINWGYSLNEGGETEAADTKYEEAVDLAPDNINVVQTYISYLLYKGDGLSGENTTIAKARLADFAQYFTKEGEEKDAYDSLVYTIDLYDQIFNSTSTSTVTEPEAQTSTEAETTTTTTTEENTTTTTEENTTTTAE